MAAALGKYWFLFAGFLAFNLIDWLTGWAKSRMKGESCSKVGAIGAMKKVWYWVVIAIAFYIGYSFAQMGETIGVGLGFMQFIGWFVLANYLVNEIRSILENLVEMGVNVPPMLIKGLKVAAERIDAPQGIGGEDDGKETKACRDIGALLPRRRRRARSFSENAKRRDARFDYGDLPHAGAQDYLYASRAGREPARL